MNHLFTQTTRTNYIISIILLLCFLGLTSCHSDKNIQTEVPVIRLSPEDAGTLKISDFFESYKLYEFKGILFTGIYDFLELGDKRVAILNYSTMAGNSAPNTLAIFDTTGHFLYQIGKNGRGPGEHIGLGFSINIQKDSSFDIIDLDGNKYLNYSLDNKVNKEQIPLYNKEGGYPALWLNDTLLLMKYSDNAEALRAQQYYITLYLPEKKKIHKSYLLPDPSQKDYLIKLQSPYLVNDTICIYSEEQDCIYNIFADTITPRYYFDKGKHDGFILMQDFIARKNDPNLITSLSNFENTRYLFGQYFYNQSYYYYIYDKKNKITYNYKNVNEDLVFMNDKNNSVWPSQVILFNNYPIQSSNEYLYIPMKQSTFRQLIEDLENKLSPQEWENYRQTHSDILQAYDNYDEETNNPVIIGFKYK